MSMATSTTDPRGRPFLDSGFGFRYLSSDDVRTAQVCQWIEQGLTNRGRIARFGGGKPIIFNIWRFPGLARKLPLFRSATKFEDCPERRTSSVAGSAAF